MTHCLVLFSSPLVYFQLNRLIFLTQMRQYIRPTSIDLLILAPDIYLMLPGFCGFIIFAHYIKKEVEVEKLENQNKH